MSRTCAEPSFPASASGLGPSVLLSVLLSVFASVLLSMLRSAEAGKVGSGAVGRVGVTRGPAFSLPWRPALAIAQDKGETGEKREEQRSLTGQKAEPLGMKFTLFLSGQEKRGKPLDLQDLKTTQVLLIQLFGFKSSLSYITVSFNVLLRGHETLH